MATRAPEAFHDEQAPREWFSASELADFALPGMPAEKRGIARKAQDA